MQVGSLEIVMLANMARLQEDMNKAKGIVGRSMKNIEGAVSSAKSVLASLGIGLGVGYFVSLIKGSIDSMDHLHDLSKTTNIAVEQLAGLRVAAKQSGSDLDGLAMSINKLSQNIGKDAEKFKALGVSAKDPLEAFKQLSDIYVALEDPQQRAAVMAAALGKSWATAAPLLAEGGKKIGELVERGSKLSGVTKDMTDQADALNDKWVLLGGTGGMLTRLVAPLLPILNMLADDMLKVQEKTKGMDGEFKPLLETFKAVLVFGGNVSFVLKGIGHSAGVMAALVAAAGRGSLKEMKLIGKEATENERLARIAFDAWEKKILEFSATAVKADEAVSAADAAAKAKAAAIAAAKAKAFLNDGEALKEANRIADLQMKEFFRVNDAIDARMKATAELNAKLAQDTANINADLSQDLAQQAQYRYDAAVAGIEKERLSIQEKYGEEIALAKEYDDYLTALRRKQVDDSLTPLEKVGKEWANTTEQMQDATARWARATAASLTDMVMSGKADFKSLADAIIRDLVRIFIQEQLTGLIGKTNTSLQVGSGLLGLFTGGSFASGGTHPGGARIVGENGPEMEVTGPSRIYNAEQTKKMVSGGGSTYIIDARGADREGMSRLEKMIRQVDGSIEHRSVSAWVKDRSRGGPTAAFG